MLSKTELNSRSILFSSFNIMSHFIYTDLISSLLDPRLVDPGSLWSMLAHTTLSII